MKWLAALALGAVLHPAVIVRDTEGVKQEPLKVEKGRAEALFFITHDCPISNYYSHEIRRICEDYSKHGLSCALVYVDPTITDEQARKHAAEYGHGDYPRIVDRNHDLVKATGADITPTAVLVKSDETIAYRGRIDNFYAALGKPRAQATEHDLRDALDAVFSGHPVAKPEAPPIGCYIPDLKAYGK
ncbi:MAG TPA: hypothetical protein VG273_25840 [Bryobacteraceae bacterium]|jgi:hypothetical protein|nr:hypothetical protein [Bryobacteraceae bacterium]